MDIGHLIDQVWLFNIDQAWMRQAFYGILQVPAETMGAGAGVRDREPDKARGQTGRTRYK